MTSKKEYGTHSVYKLQACGFLNMLKAMINAVKLKSIPPGNFIESHYNCVCMHSSDCDLEKWDAVSVPRTLCAVLQHSNAVYIGTETCHRGYTAPERGPVVTY